MRLLDTIRSHFRQTRREDPIFGSMLYMGDKLGYWEGKAKFAPSATEIEVFVDGLAADDLQLQHEFFKKFCEEWSKLRVDIGRKLQETWREWNPRDSRGSVWDQFVPVSVRIPKASIDESEWEVSFSTPSDYHLFSVQMKGRQPVAVTVDG